MNIYLVIYETPKKGLVVRQLKNVCLKKVGQVNNFGWKVVDVQIYHDGKFMSLSDYYLILNKNIKGKKKGWFKR